MPGSLQGLKKYLISKHFFLFLFSGDEDHSINFLGSHFKLKRKQNTKDKAIPFVPTKHGSKMHHIFAEERCSS